MSWFKSLMRMDTLLLVVIVGVALYFMLRRPKALSNLLGFNKHPSQQPTQARQQASPSVSVPSISPDTARQKMQDKAVIAFMADFCGHCKNMKPDFFEAAAAVPGVYWVDASDDKEANQLVEDLGIQGFPSVLFFEKGVKIDEYKGARKAGAFKSAFSKFLGK